MNRILPCILAILLALHLPAIGQQAHCADDFVREHLYRTDPLAQQRAQEADATLQSLSNVGNRTLNAVVTIPVVVHVVYNTPAQNISDQQIASQIAVLNQDFRALNTDLLPAGHPFKGLVADCELEFCLAQTDPSGNATSGITRTATATMAYDLTNLFDVKFSWTGGKDNWDPTRYLNVWVCNIGLPQVYGYSTFPQDLVCRAVHDGVVVHYQSFGTQGTAIAPTNNGRVAVHEIGHWLGLRHIWGDSLCGNDQVGDTPPAQEANLGCPSFPHRANNQCGSNANGEMFMNYMDYVDDGCMNMFTIGQKDRMHNALNTYRSALLSSTACAPVAIAEPLPAREIHISPNPSNGVFRLDISGDQTGSHTYRVIDPLGKAVVQQGEIAALPYRLDLSSLPAGVYYLQVGAQSGFHKLVILH